MTENGARVGLGRGGAAALEALGKTVTSWAAAIRDLGKRGRGQLVTENRGESGLVSSRCSNRAICAIPQTYSSIRHSCTMGLP